MEVVLLEDVKALGKKGQIVKVNDGYARNYILPKKLGVEANAMYTRCGFTRHRPMWLPYPELPMPGWTNLWELRLGAPQ